MIRVALRGLLGRKLRATLTAVAIVLGVAMVSGTYVLTDSIDRAFDNIFSDSRQGSNAVISGKSAFDLTEGSGATAPSFDESLLDEVRGAPDVAAAEGSVDGEAQIIGDDGKAIVYGGAPNLGFSIADGESRFNPLQLVDGAWPGDNEVVIDQATADKEDFKLGDTVGIQGAGRVQDLTISGFVRFGSVSTIGGATLAGFDLPTAQRIFDKEGKLDEIAVAAQSGVSDDELVQQLQPDPARQYRGSDGGGTGPQRRRGHRRVHLLPPDVPARLRGHRALRRLLRDRELALDHDRTAHAGVRDAADDRRIAPAGAQLDHRGVARGRGRSHR